MAAAAVKPAAVAFCLCAVLLSCSVSTASGAWPWELGLLKNKTTTTEVATSQTPKATTGSTTTTTPLPPTVESTPRLRSRHRSNAKKHHPHTTTTPQTPTKDNTANTTTTTEAPPPSVPPVAVETEPQYYASVQPQLPAAPPPEMSPIVIVEPDSYADAGRAYRSMYQQPYGGMYPPPMPYSAPSPYYSPPPPPSLPPYPSVYDPYSFGGYPSYPSYQWPAVEPSYLRPYRSYPYAPVPPLGGYPTDYSPYPWWNPQVQALAAGAAAPAAGNGCLSEPKRDREDLAPALLDAPVDQKAEEPSPTYVSLLPSYAGNVPPLDTSKPSTTKESNMRVEGPYTVEKTEGQPNMAPGSNAYGVGDTTGRETHILRNNPYQPQSPSAYWPGYYDQSQWPQWSPWQQWQGSMQQQQQQQQQQQYTYGAAPQQPAEVPSEKRQAPVNSWGGRRYG